MNTQTHRHAKSLLENPWIRSLSLVLVLYPFIKHGWAETAIDRYVGFDFEIFYQAAEDLKADRSPYSEEVFYGQTEPTPTEVAGVYVYPAFFARLLTPLTSLSPFNAKWVFLIVTYGIVLLLLFPSPQSLMAALQRKGPFWISLFIPICFLFSWGPVIENLRFGQSNLLALALFCAAWKLSKDSRSGGRETFAGILIGLACMIKLTPFLIVPFLILTSQWRALCGVGLGAFLALVLSGYEETKEFFLDVLPVVSMLEDSPRAIDLGSILDRHLPGAIGTVLLLGMIAALLVWVFPKRRHLPLSSLILLGAFLPTVFTGIWYHHYILALLPLVVLVPEKLQSLHESLRDETRTGTVLQGLILLFSLLLGFYYWPPIRNILESRGGDPFFNGLEIFVMGHAVVFAMLLPRLVEPDERIRTGK